MSIFTSITETAKIPAEALRAMPPEVRSQQDADHAAAAVVDNAGQRLLHLLLCIRRHSHQLVGQTLPHHVVQALPEEICAPNLLRIVLEFLQADSCRKYSQVYYWIDSTRKQARA